MVRFQLHDGPLALWGGGVLRGEAGHRDAGGRVVHGRDELGPALEALLLGRQDGRLRIQAVARQGQRLLDEVLGQVKLLGHGVDHAQGGLVVREQLPEQAPVLLGKTAVPSLLWLWLLLLVLLLLGLQSYVPALVQTLIKGFSHIHLVNGREGFGRSTVM